MDDVNGRGCKMPKNIAINADCMEIMRQYPDKHFDLAVVDPPYGEGGDILSTVHGLVGFSNDTLTRTGGTWAKKYGKKS